MGARGAAAAPSRLLASARMPDFVSGTDVMDGSGLTGPTIPDRWRAVRRGSIHIGRHAVMGANVVVHPDVTIGEGTIVGSQSLVTKDLPRWSICVGVPARVVRRRESADDHRLRAGAAARRGALPGAGPMPR
jgi:acetyltransferase-like isoleucine patch superfamily enzyme